MSVKCPACHCKHCPVTHTYNHTIHFHGQTIQLVRRRRVCRHCGMPFFTREREESDKDEKLPTNPTDDLKLPENPFL